MKKVLIVHMSYHTEAHRKTLHHVRTVLRQHGVECKSVHRAQLTGNLVRGKDLIVAVGGDGTFLRASHFLKDKTPIMGVNSDPSHKEGFFLKTTIDTFEKHLDIILSGTAKLTEFTRLKATLGGKPIPELALNEFYIGSRRGYRMAAYIIHFKRRYERQKSTGIIVAAGAGTYAWLKSAGGKPTALDAKKAQFVVREIYGGKLTGSRLLKGTLSPGDSVEITSEMPDGIVIADSVGKEHHFPFGKKVRIELAKNPLCSYWF
jgi:NAD+ kinase